jgi:hypothetical protein
MAQRKYANLKKSKNGHPSPGWPCSNPLTLLSKNLAGYRLRHIQSKGRRRHYERQLFAREQLSARAYQVLTAEDQAAQFGAKSTPKGLTISIGAPGRLEPARCFHHLILSQVPEIS